jgi:hypothetical protein
MINYDSFFLWSMMTKAGWPILKSFKAKRKRVLSWRKSRALIYHHFVSRKHISSLKVTHRKVSIRRGTNIFGTMIELVIFLRLTIRDVHVLNQHLHTSVSKSCPFGIAAIGSNGGGGRGRPGLWRGGAGRCSSLASNHLTH